MMEDGAWLEASLAQILPDADADARDGTNPPSSFLIHLLVFAHTLRNVKRSTLGDFDTLGQK
jgi:hypothetical protein